MHQKYLQKIMIKILGQQHLNVLLGALKQRINDFFLESNKELKSDELLNHFNDYLQFFFMIIILQITVFVKCLYSLL